MLLKILLITLSIISTVQAATGQTVQCTAGANNSCSVQYCSNVPTGCSWLVAGAYPSCQISDCSCYKAGSVSGLTDLVCQSCDANNKYANTVGTSCVASSNSCQNRGTTDWTKDDCQKCYSSTYTLLNKSCFNCSLYSGLTDEICTACSSDGTKIFANKYGTACVGSSRKCDINITSPAWAETDCKLCFGDNYVLNGNICSNCFSTSQLTDQICALCATAQGNKNKYANSAGSSCIEVSASCNSQNRGSTVWTTSDCALCTPSTPIVSSGGACSVDSSTTTVYSQILINSLFIIIISFI